MENEGWRFSGISSGAHLKRWIAEYQEMGFEIYLEKVDRSQENKDSIECGSECTACYDNEIEQPYRMYIKQLKS